MRTFINPQIPVGVPGHAWQFEDDVIVEVSTVTVGEPGNETTEERRQFFAPHGARLNVPDTLVPGELPAPPAPTLDDLKAAKLSTINAKAEELIAPYMEGYPDFEIKTWPKQEAEAKAFALDPNAPTPFCDIAAARRGIDRVDFIGRVAYKAELFTQVSADISGYRQGLEDQIDDAKTPEELDLVVWAYEPEGEPE